MSLTRTQPENHQHIAFDGSENDAEEHELAVRGAYRRNDNNIQNNNADDWNEAEDIVEETPTNNNTNNNFQPTTYDTVKIGKGTYAGYFRNKKRDGQGIYIDRHGNRYVGAWKDDRADGYGKKEFKKTTVDRHPKRS